MNRTLAALFRTLAMGPGEIGFDLDLAPATLSLHQAIPCGLIVNELVSNSDAWKWVRAKASPWTSRSLPHLRPIPGTRVEGVFEGYAHHVSEPALALNRNS